MLKPDTNPPTNCVLDCPYYYYYSNGQFRCTIIGQCPIDNNLLIRAKNKCVYNCSLDSFYIYQYNSECFEICPINTDSNEFNICEDKNINICSLSEFELDLNIKDLNSNNIKLCASNYAKEYSYTNNHISKYDNEIYSYILFKNSLY